MSNHNEAVYVFAEQTSLAGRIVNEPSKYLDEDGGCSPDIDLFSASKGEAIAWARTLLSDPAYGTPRNLRLRKCARSVLALFKVDVASERPKHCGLIENLTVASNLPYIVYGAVRGLVSEHRLLRAAQWARLRNQADCHSLPGGNAYSDACVYCWDDEDGWCLDATNEDG